MRTERSRERTWGLSFLLNFIALMFVVFFNGQQFFRIETMNFRRRGTYLATPEFLILKDFQHRLQMTIMTK